MTSTHFVRLEPDVFRVVTLGEQHAFVIARDRGLVVGDQVVFREWRSKPPGLLGPTGLWLMRRVTHLLPGGTGTGIETSHVVASLNSASENEWASTHMKRRLSLAERAGLSPDRFWRIEERREGARRGVLREPSIGGAISPRDDGDGDYSWTGTFDESDG